MALGTCPMQGTGFLGMGYGWILQIVVFMLFFLVVWWLLKSNSPSIKGEGRKVESPTEILKRRLATGEITKKEYYELKEEIE
jgi:putative membrane protein